MDALADFRLPDFRLAGARLASSAAARSLPAFRAAGRAGRFAEHVSPRAAAAAARRALATVPAYADFAGPGPGRAPAAEWLSQLPVADKKSYIDAYPLAARCRHGVLPAAAELDESSGSTGQPYTWIRSVTELEQVRRKLSIMVRHLIQDETAPGRPVVTPVTFPAGRLGLGGLLHRELGRRGEARYVPDHPASQQQQDRPVQRGGVKRAQCGSGRETSPGCTYSVSG